MAQTFGEWLKDKREEKGFSQTSLAKSSGVTKGYISNLERNIRQAISNELVKPSVAVVDKLAKALNIDVNQARMVAGYAPQVGSRQYHDQVIAQVEKLKEGILASGVNDIEDPETQTRLFEDIQRIAETMIQQEIRRQEGGGRVIKMVHPQ